MRSTQPCPQRLGQSNPGRFPRHPPAPGESDPCSTYFTDVRRAAGRCGVRVAPGRQTARSPSRGRPELHRRWMSSDAPRGRMLRADLAATGQTPGCGGISTRPTRTGSTPTIATVAKPPSVVPDPQAAYPTPLGRTASVEPTTRRCWTNSGRAPVRCPVRQGLAPSADGGGPATAAPHRPGPRRRSRSPAAGPR